MSDTNENIHKRLSRIETLLTQLVEGRTKKDYYSTSEIARILNRAV